MYCYGNLKVRAVYLHIKQCAVHGSRMKTVPVLRKLSVSWERQRQTDDYHTSALMEVCLGCSRLTREVPASNQGEERSQKRQPRIVGLWEREKA